ncbi:hypothetical protein Noda2021_10600 [Candidatus Dependentiae bacterium Noda2021]|nr:hypothetical protein Noda2021_10600 [Candidatus Dependentiae bacterium Noda2021]
MKKLLLVLSTLFSTQTFFGFIEKTVFSGTIQFPLAVKKVPDVRVYCAGRKICGELDHETKKISFAISDYRQRTFFYLAIASAKNIGYELAVPNSNTIKYLKVDPTQPYKFYAIELVLIPEDANTETASKSPTMVYKWLIKEIELPTTGQMPDDTIIVCYDPNYVERLDGGSSFEFPKIVIKPDILSIVGSESTLHQESAKILLSTLDLDTIHASVRQEIKQFPYPKTIVAFNI